MGNRVVYQPAYEAEVEYLESTGKQHIDTGVVTSSELGIIAHIAVMNDNTTYLFGGADERSIAEYGFMAVTSGNTSSFRFGSKSVDRSPLNTGVIYEFDNTSNHNILTVGESSYQAQFNEFVSSFNFYLFAENRSGSSWNGAGVRIYDFKIYSGSTLVRDFIPVRIGTTGYMYDKVSRQLFANAGARAFVLGNDVANATVPQLRHVVYFGGLRCVGFEKVYEKCAWLKGRNGAYIDTQQKIKAFDDKFDVRYRYDGNIKNPDNGVQDVFGYASQDDNDWIRHYITSSNYAASNYFKQAGDWYHSGIITNDATIELWADISSFYYKVNGNNFTFSTNGLEAGEYPNCYVFACNGLKQVYPNRYFHGDIAYFRITDPTSTTDRINMFPCRLLVDIPAILDGNGIARQAGTCGMWDTVSGRFFGNVADMGTFDVVYMEEDVDYEVHQWLVGHLDDGVSPTGKSNGAKFRLDRSIDLTNKVMKMKFDTPCRDFAIYGEVVSAGNQYCLRTFIFEDGSQYIRETIGSTEINSISQSTKNDEVIFDFVNNVASAGNISIPIQGTGYSYSNVYGVYWSLTKKIGNITIDNELNLIPVKLLRSIPSKYDANGIARNAGECGMYDTVNDLFYGNVASNGTFSVSDD